MAKKRFTLTNRSLSEIGNDIAIADDGVPCTQRFVCNLLNELIEENEQLKSRVDYLERKIQRERMSYQKQHEKWEKEIKDENEELKQFKEKVFVLLDEKIKHYGHKPFSAPVGQPMSVNFDADVDRIARLSELQDLKKELQE